MASSAVTFNGIAHAATLTSPNQLTITLSQADLASAGAFAVIVTNPSPGGGASLSADLQIAQVGLMVDIVDLPAGASGNVAVTGPNGLSLNLSSSQMVTGDAGTYQVSAAGVAFATNRYFASIATQNVVLAEGNSSSVTVDYFTIIPQTTKVLDQAGMQSLTVSADGSTLTISDLSAVAESLAAGDVLASAPTGAAPNGFLVKVLTATDSGGVVTATVAQASLEQAIQQINISFGRDLGPDDLLPSFSRAHTRKEGVLRTQSSDSTLADSCSDKPNTFSNSFSFPVTGPLDDLHSSTLSGTLEFCPHFDFNLEIVGFKVQSFSASISMGEHTHVVAEVGLLGDVSKEFDSPTIPFAAIPLPAPFPLYVTPAVTPFIKLGGSMTAALAGGVSQDATCQAGASYSDGAWSPIQTLTSSAAYDPLSFDGSMDGKFAVGMQADLLFYGAAGPFIGVDGYMDFHANPTSPPSDPWWTLSAGVEGPIGMHVSVLGHSLGDFSLPDVFNYSRVLLHASGGFLASDVTPTLTSIAPTAVSAGSSGVVLSVVGSKFVPDSVVYFDGIALPTVFEDVTDLSATVSASYLVVPGSHIVTVTNPDTSGATSTSLPFTVSGPSSNPIPSLSSVVPPSIPVGNFTLTVNGSNFVQGAQVLFGGVGLATQFVSSTQLTATGTATVSQVGSVPVVVSNPIPGGGLSNIQSVTVVNASSSSSGSTGILPETVNGQLVDVAFVPQPFQGTVAVVNVDATSPTGALITPIAMPIGYQPNATAVNPGTSQVLVISYGSPVVQVIDASNNTLAATYTAPVTAFAAYSGGGCQICGAVIDPVSGKAILDTAQGTILMDMSSGTFSAPFANLTAENFAYNPNTQIALLPTYDQGSFVGLQTLNLSNGSIAQLSANIGTEPDSAAIDLVTNLAVIPDENTATEYIVNMQQAAYSNNTFTAPITAFTIAAPVCEPFWTLASIENVTHTLFAGTEFDSCLGVTSLPAAPVTGTPPAPTTFSWGRMPSSPDGNGWDNGGDPHGIAVFTSVVDGKSYGFLVDSSGPWVARIDLAGLAVAPPLNGGSPGQVDPSPYVTFLKTQ